MFMKHTEEQVSLEGQNVTNSFIPLSGSPGSLTCDLSNKDIIMYFPITAFLADQYSLLKKRA